MIVDSSQEGISSQSTAAGRALLIHVVVTEQEYNFLPVHLRVTCFFCCQSGSSFVGGLVL